MDRKLAMLCALVAGIPVFAFANPQDGVVVGGAASIHAPSEQKLDIIQHTDRVAIDWRRFDIGKGQHTEFHQPHANAVALNRVITGGASQIDGRLTANGNVVIVNQNGVIFGKNAQVDVNGLVASTADIDTTKFMAGSLAFDKPGNPGAAVENHGSITARQAGLVGLVAPKVANAGVINARLGRAHLASGDTATLDFYGDGLIEVKVSDAVQAQLVENSGTIRADGGVVALTAAAGRDMVNSLVKVDGALYATAVEGKSGRVVIAAEGSHAVTGNAAGEKDEKSGQSTVLASGGIDVSSADGEAGQVTITADRVGLLSGSTIDARGATRGGTVRVGGEYLGKGATPVAQAAVMQQGANIYADATRDGHGGEVILYADGHTEFGGSITANAAGSGDGGFVETSGRESLLVNGGSVVATSANGRKGSWLLDPANLEVTTTSASSGQAGSNPDIFVPAAANSRIANSTILTALNAGTDVILQTGGDALAGNGDITVSAPILSTALTGGATQSGNLTLSAFRNVIVNRDITLQNGNLTLRANNAGAPDGSSGVGAVRVVGQLTTHGGDITIGGGNGAITPGEGYAVGHGNSSDVIGVQLTRSVDAGGGTVIVNGMGNRTRTGSGNAGIRLNNGAVLSSAGGMIHLHGIGGGAGASANNHGVLIHGSNSSGDLTTLSLQNAAQLFIHGQGGNSSTGNNNNGVMVAGGARILAAGIGTLLDITGFGGGNGSGSTQQGVNVSNANSLIEVRDGATGTIRGTAGSGGATSSNAGVYMSAAARIGVSGAGSQLRIEGTGGQTGRSEGINITGANTVLSAANGAKLDLAGHGSTLSTRAGNYGISLLSNARIEGTGDTVIRLEGEGGGSGATTGNYGIFLNGALNLQDGAKLYMNGQGGKTTTGSSNNGININNATRILISGAGTLLDMTGIAGGNHGGGALHGVNIAGASITQVLDGAMALIRGIGGTGASGSGSNAGVVVSGGANMTVSGTGSQLRVEGTGGHASRSEGINIANTATVFSVTDGAKLDLIGRGGTTPTGAYNYGISLTNSRIEGAGNAAIRIEGYGGGSGTSAGNYGVRLSNSGRVSVEDGATLSIHGQGGANSTGNSNIGVHISAAARIVASGAGALLDMTGLGGGNNGGGTHYGVYITGANSLIDVLGGATGTIRGTGGTGASNSSANAGVFVTTAGRIGVSGAGSQLRIEGTGGHASRSEGISVTGTNSRLTAADGAALDLIGWGGTTPAGAGNYGVSVLSSARIAGSDDAAIRIEGHGGGSGSSTGNTGIFLGTGTTTRTADGQLTLAGYGGNNGGGTTTNNHGIRAYGGTIGTTGSGSIRLQGVKGGGATNSFGLFLYNLALATIGDSGARDVALFADTLSLSGMAAQAGGTLSISPYSDTPMSIGTLTGGGLHIAPSLLGNVSASRYRFDATTTAAGTANSHDVIISGALDAGDRTIEVHAARDLILRSGTGIASSSGDGLVLVAGRHFLNQSGSATPFTLTGGGRWLVYSQDPAYNLRGGLLPDASDFGKTYATDAPLSIGAGNRFIYATATRPVLTLNTGNASVTYGDALSASDIAYSYGSGLVGDDVWGAIGLQGEAGFTTGYVQGTTGYRSTAYTGMVRATTGTLSSVLGYDFAFTAGDLNVTRRMLEVGLGGVLAKTYDGTTAIAAGSVPYSYTNRYGLDDVYVGAHTVGSYAQADVGSGIAFTLDGLSLAGDKAANYQLVTTSLSGQGTITPRPLLVTTRSATKIIGQPDPVFSGSNNLLSADAAQVRWHYAPVAYNGHVGTYTIEATIDAPDGQLANYQRINRYGSFTVKHTPVSSPEPDVPSTALPANVEYLSQRSATDDASGASGAATDSIRSDKAGKQRSGGCRTASGSDAWCSRRLYQVSPELDERFGSRGL